MRENSKALLERLVQDEGLRAGMAGATSADEAYAIASEAVPGLGRDEFAEAIAELGGADEELSLDDLESAAGGVAIDPEVFLRELSAKPLAYTVTWA